MNSLSQRLGIFGGTFDPIHFGHLALARALRETFALPQVRLIPTGLPPHRDAPPVSPQQRFELVQLALAGEPGLVADDREIRRSGYCYTIDTLAEIQRENPQAVLVWLIGGDSFLNLQTWRRWRELLDAGHMVVAARPGFDFSALPSDLAEEFAVRTVLASPGTAEKGRISVLPTPLLPFSSTEIRARIARGEDVAALTPVADAIHRAGFYR
ncbi:nicotinate-nucleotide adenylyltransferase [Formivibrio citricus]|nr:nicotinate-nucleotide adenylyltransferase [Formivibrio citricus]